VAKIAGKLAGGTYTVRWRAVAADGAEGDGSFQFMYMACSEH
jgi:methionine-rich copper-binding protein CopC